MAACAFYRVGDKAAAFVALDHALINRLLARKPSPAMAQHAEERGALAKLTSLCAPRTSACWRLGWARSLLQRGAGIHARSSDGYTPLQSWCSAPNTQSAAGIIVLLEAGADFDASHPEGKTALWLLCNNLRVQVLRELLAARCDFDVSMTSECGALNLSAAVTCATGSLPLLADSMSAAPSFPAAAAATGDAGRGGGGGSSARTWTANNGRRITSGW